MSITTAERSAALAAQMEQEVRALEDRGVRIAGNAYSPILLVKGSLNAEEAAGGDLLGGADGRALRAALSAIGWAPEDFCALAVVAGPGDGTSPAVAPGESLGTELFREALEALNPEAVVLLDPEATAMMREACADALAIIEDFDTAMLEPGLVASVLGRRVLSIDGFEASLADPRKKQVAWAYLKQLPPLGAPY